MSAKAPGRALKYTSLAIRTAVGLAILALGAGIAFVLFATRPELPPRAAPEAALTVGTVPATRTDVDRVWPGYGTARAMNSAALAAQVAGAVVERPEAVEPGNPIQAGDLIVQIEQTDYLARVRAAEQLVSQAQAELAALEVDEAAWAEQVRLADEQAEIERRELAQAYQALEAGAATASEIDRRTKALRALEVQASTVRQQLQRVDSQRAALQANLERLRADLQLAEQNLRRTAITSPISGILERVDIEQDEYLNVGSPVARVVDVSRIEIPLRIAASALGYVRVGSPAVLRPDGPGTHTWEGAVVRISPEIDPETRSVTVFVEVTQPADAFLAPDERSPTLLLPGQFVTGQIVGAPEPGSVLVPRRAVQDSTLYLAQPNDQGLWTARRTPVDPLFHTTGDFPGIDPLERQWTVLPPEALPEGARVIVTNLDAMIDGLVVNIASRAPDASPVPDDAPDTGDTP